MNNQSSFIGKLFYAIGFLFIIPGILLFWAYMTEHLIPYPELQGDFPGWFMIILGIILMLWAMYYLIKYGYGLPMNAYPPKNLVKSGPYRLLRHPIYWGFGFLMVGYFILTGSASGLWLVAPLTIIGMTALVLGYESIDIKNRFPNDKLIPILDIPEQSMTPVSFRDSLVSLFWIIVILVCTNLLVLTATHDTASDITWSFIYTNDSLNIFLSFLGLGILIFTPFLLRFKRSLRTWCISSIIALSLLFIIGVLFPSLGKSYFYPTHLRLASIPISLILICFWAIFKESQLLSVIVGLVSSVAIIGYLLNQSEMVIHLSIAISVFLISVNYRGIWAFLRDSNERLANSWEEWTFGKIRIINHGFYAGLATFVGICYAGFLVGKIYAWAILIFAITVLIIAALWAQIIEGSEKLKRPFGFYGGVVGVLFAFPIVRLLGFDGWIILGAVTMAMPWVQAIGRLKCVVNGCCHGRKVEDSAIGIRYFHERTRVCGISHLKGQLIHPTQLYSILWLILVGFILRSLWNHQFSYSFIFGIYLILTGLGRFVEEAYRGEVQTPIIAGLRLYQWTAIFTIFIGIFISLIPGTTNVQAMELGWEIILAATLGGLFTTFAMGIDFPYSNIRFSRLV